MTAWPAPALLPPAGHTSPGSADRDARGPGYPRPGPLHWLTVHMICRTGSSPDGSAIVEDEDEHEDVDELTCQSNGSSRRPRSRDVALRQVGLVVHPTRALETALGAWASRLTRLRRRGLVRDSPRVLVRGGSH
jgi:hypothetical protein